jgi:hypothetical protein
VKIALKIVAAVGLAVALRGLARYDLQLLFFLLPILAVGYFIYKIART